MANSVRSVGFAADNQWSVNDALTRNRFVWVFGAALIAIVMTLGKDPISVWRTIFDPDDATRLLQVRALLDGASWYDTTLPQLGLPEPLVSHWSRLVDVPLAILLGGFETMFSPKVAETIVRVVWPVAVFLPMLWIVVGVTERAGGARAVLFAMMLVVTSGYATFQFMPGRVDHHNLQILGCAGGLLLLIEALRKNSRGYTAGALLGVSVAVGYEAMPLIFAIIGAGVMIAAFCKSLMRVLAEAVFAMAMVMGLAFVVTTPPGQWMSPACDALGINLVALVSIGALTLLGSLYWRRTIGLSAQLALLTIGGGLAAGAYTALNPACLAGPMAAVDPAIRDIWLANVAEGTSLRTMLEMRKPIGFVYVLTMLVAVGIAFARWRRSGAGADLFCLAAFVIAALYGAVFSKLFAYAIWIAIPTIAVALSQLKAIGSTPARTVQMAGLLALNHVTLMLAGAGLFAVTAPTSQAAIASERASADARRCYTRTDFEKLRALPPGRVMNDLYLGPLIALETNMTVMSGPYHRLSGAIVGWHEITTGTVDHAKARLAGLDIDYVILCGAEPANRPTRLSEAFEIYLLQGGKADFLEEIRLVGLTQPLRVWRVVKSRF